MWVRLEIRLQDNVTLHVGTHVGVEQNVILQCVKHTVYSVHYAHNIHALNTREWCIMKHGLHCALHNTIHYVCIVYVQWTVLNIEWILCFVKSMRELANKHWEHTSQLGSMGTKTKTNQKRKWNQDDKWRNATRLVTLHPPLCSLWHLFWCPCNEQVKHNLIMICLYWKNTHKEAINLN